MANKGTLSDPRYGCVEFYLDMSLLRFIEFDLFILESSQNLTDDFQVMSTWEIQGNNQKRHW